MERIQWVHTTEYRLSDSIAQSIQTFAAAELLLLAALRILRSEFPLWILESGDFWFIQGWLALVILLFGVLAPACGRYRVRMYAVFEAAVLAVGGFKIWQQREPLYHSFIVIFNDYLVAWNDYFGTNYRIEHKGQGQIGDALYFALLILVLLFLMLRYLVGVRFFMLVVPVLAIALGLLVGNTPDASGLAYLFIGIVLLYGGAKEQFRVLFLPLKKEKVSSGVAQLLHTLAAALLAGVIVLFVSHAFREPAEQIPKKTEMFMQFQNKLEAQVEQFVLNLTQPDKTYVDNATPSYEGDRILTICADKKPQGNLYLMDFYSATYHSGRWEQEERVYERAANEHGADGERIGMLIRQMAYENICQMAENDELYRGKTTYSIRYDISTNRALLPYFSEVTDNQKDVWVVGEGLTVKDRKTEMVSFVGWNDNVIADVLELDEIYTAAYQTQGEAVAWYSEYVAEHCKNGAELPALQALAASYAMDEAELPALQALASGYAMDEAGDSDSVNLNRLALATAVRGQLSSIADYNLYLDDIPAGTDTIQYFLETGHEGYCMHFASAGALLLQELGVPARYASGYIVKQDAFKERGDSYEAEVFDRNGHAWVEVYLEGIGWVPCEMTPGYSHSEDSLPTDADNQELLQEQHAKKEQETPEAETQKAETEDTPVTQTQESQQQEEYTPDTKAPASSQNAALHGALEPPQEKPWKDTLQGIGIACIVLCMVIGAGRLIYRTYRRYQEILWRELHKKHYRSAVCRMNRRIYRNLKKRARTDTEYEQKLIQTYPTVTPEEWHHYMEIVKKAVFSHEKISWEEAAWCCDIYRRYKGKPEKSTGR